MDLMKKALFKRTRSSTNDASSSSSSSSMRVSDTMTVDLSRTDALPALQMLCKTPTLSDKVKYATVHADCFVKYDLYGDVIKLDGKALVEVFQLLSELSRLQQVTVDLSDLKVPVAALTALLRGSKALRELHLLNLNLVGPTQELELALKGHTKLQTVRLQRCSGSAVQSFMTQLPCLKKLEMRYTQVGCFDTLQRPTNPWFALGSSTTLTSLTVQEIPDLCTEHALDYITALTEQQMLCRSQLQELHMTSVNPAVVGQVVGAAMADLFLFHSKITLKTLTLKFGNTWPHAGATVASMLQRNPVNLTSLCVQLCGKEATKVHGRALLKALPANTHLKRLKLCLDRVCHLDGPVDPTFLTDLEALLWQQGNHTLQNVVVLDEHREKYPLTAAITHKLELNASKLPALLYQDNNNTCSSLKKQPSSQPNEYIKAMIDSKDNLNVLFYAISNHPELLLNVNHHTAQSPSLDQSSRTSSFLSLSDSDDDSSSAAYLGKVVTAVSKRKSPTSKAKKTMKKLLSL